MGSAVGTAVWQRRAFQGEGTADVQDQRYKSRRREELVICGYQGVAMRLGRGKASQRAGALKV